MNKPNRPDFIAHFQEIQEPEENNHYPNDKELFGIESNFSKKMGLKKLGIHHQVLPPGRRTSWPHAESVEEEFVYVITGHPDAWIDGVLYPLNPGDAVGFPSGTGITHTFINNTKSAVSLLVVGEATKKENQFFYQFHPEANEESRKQGLLWENPPKRPLGNHNGKPDGA